LEPEAPIKRRTPDEWLEKAAPAEKTSGTLKIFLGYAPGVGKTYNMLSEAIRRKSRGEDVVIGVIETHGRAAVGALTEELEQVPRKTLSYKGTEFKEMDVDAIIARKPSVVLIDELAHTNIEGSKHRKRYEDVLEILNANIDVLATVNVQHVESATPTIQSITGVPVREIVPDWVLKRAEEVVLVDLTPEALEERMRRGDIYGTSRAESALKNFFRRGNLIALRELALRHVTQSVDRSLEAYLRKKHIDANWGVAERVAVSISCNSAAQQLIARGARLSEALDAEFYVVHVPVEEDMDEESKKSLFANVRFAQNLGAKYFELKDGDIASGVASFVREYKITQILFGRSAVKGLRRYLYLNAIQRFMENAPHVDVHIITQEGR
jgi:two-component system, OmpR family, sensor histidine kinase KdpD